MKVIKTFTFEQAIRQALIQMFEYPIAERTLVRLAYKKGRYSRSRIAVLTELYENYAMFRDEDYKYFMVDINMISSLEILDD